LGGLPQRELSVLLVEEDDEWRGLLADAVSASGHKVHQAVDCGRGIELAQALALDVILLGRTPDQPDALEACWSLRSVSLAAMLMVRRRSAGWGDCLVIELGGAAGDVELLSFPQLVSRARMARPRHLPRGGRTLPRGADVETAGPVRVDRLARRVHVGDHELALTAKEFDLLSFLLANRGRVHPVRTILADVWGQGATARNSRTVAVHVRWLRQKLEGQRDVTIVTVRGAGYRLDVSTAGGLPADCVELAAPNS
jgi:DNA-binding response OmpR family regulator